MQQNAENTQAKIECVNMHKAELPHLVSACIYHTAVRFLSTLPVWANQDDFFKKKRNVMQKMHAETECVNVPLAEFLLHISAYIYHIIAVHFRST